MTTPNPFTFYSHPSGPFPQIVLIALLEKGLVPGRDFRIEFADRGNQSEQFLALSPTGKPPMLDIGGQPVFETAAILEYIDEAFAPIGQHHRGSAVAQSQARAWVLCGLAHLMEVFEAIMAKDRASYEAKLEIATASTERLESKLGAGPYFYGSKVAPMDFVYSAFFLRQAIFDEQLGMGLLAPFPKVAAWSEALLARPNTHAQVPEDLAQSLVGWLRSSGSYIATR